MITNLNQAFDNKIEAIYIIVEKDEISLAG
jgi:hypothetical protein